MGVRPKGKKAVTDYSVLAGAGLNKARQRNRRVAENCIF